MRQYTACFFVTLLFFTHNQISAQDYCITGRFSEKEYFSAAQIQYENNIVYGLAEKWYENKPAPVYNTFDIAFPANAADALNERPLIVLVHGGGFLGGDKNNLAEHITSLAKRGFVAVSLNYRLGWDSGSDPSGCTGDPVSLSREIYMATQDIKAAMRFLVHNAPTYGIDTGNIFMGGFSAGGMAAINSVFCSQAEYDAVDPWIKNELGPLNTVTNSLTDSYTVKGVLNMWGAIIDIDALNEPIPVISFYGTDDDIIPAVSGTIYGCTDHGYEIIAGSEGITNKLNTMGVCNQVHSNPGAGHEAYEIAYLIPNIACFVKHILCGECESGSFTYTIPACETIEVSPDNVIDISTSVKIYPNPAAEFVLVMLQEMAGDEKLQLFDMQGNLVPVKAKQIAGGFNLDVSTAEAGMYILQISNSKGVAVQKLTISR